MDPSESLSKRLPFASFKTRHWFCCGTVQPGKGFSGTSTLYIFNGFPECSFVFFSIGGFVWNPNLVDN